jgi:ubiquinone/menaquinone biosynthesis C-methylase UbiE
MRTHDTSTAVRSFWEAASCGEELYLAGTDAADYARQSQQRYQLEPFIAGFAEFDRFRDRRVLEIGVGVGADHERFAAAGAELTGIDLTERAIEHARRRLALRGLDSDLRTGNADTLPLPAESFDLVYSWGVLHHIAGDTRDAIREILRVLKPGGEARIMLYHRHSLVGYMLWLRYALATGRPRTSLAQIYAQHLESPGTRAYTVDEARALFDRFEVEGIRAQLTHADLLTSPVGQQHRGFVLDAARRVWPRWLITRRFAHHGLFLLIRARKPA